MTKCVLSMTLLAVALFAQIGLSGEPITDLKDFEAELGTWTREWELNNDHPILGKKGTKVKTVLTKEWGPGKKFILARGVNHANGKQSDGFWSLTGIDPVTKQVTYHGFAPGGGRGIGRWFRDTENKKKRMSQSQWVTGSGNVGASVRIVEEQDADTRTVQWVGNFRDGELSEGDGAINTWTREKTEK